MPSRKPPQTVAVRSVEPLPVKRCKAKAPISLGALRGVQCGHYAGHEGDRTVLRPSGAPWFFETKLERKKGVSRGK